MKGTEEVLGWYGVKVRNVEGQMAVDRNSCVEQILRVMNKSGGRYTQVD